jgi:plastocyanin
MPNWLRTLTLLALVLAGDAPHLAAQSALTRTPNLSGGWVGLPWGGQFDLLQRFFDRDRDGIDLASQPTITLALGLPGRTLAGINFAAESPVARGQSNELELYGRFAPFYQPRAALDAALQVGYNAAAESLDGEFSLARWFGPLRLLLAARLFTNGYDDGAQGALAGGLVLQPFPGRAPIALVGDVGSLFDRDNGEKWAWGAGLQIGLPFTPSTLSLQLGNTSSGTLEGASLGLSRVRFGFELTVPLPVGELFKLYVPREVAQRAVTVPPPAAPTARVVRVEIRRYAFLPDRLVVPAGTTVEWVNRDRVIHTATADDGSWDTGTIPPGDSRRATFSRPGTYAYHCGPHPFMKGVVVVR